MPLLPPFPHWREMLESTRTGLRAESDAGAHVLEMPETYAQEKERHT